MSRIIKGRAPELASLLMDQSEGERIPFDITFKIVEFGEVADEEEGGREEVKAHRLILGSYSTVFKAMFYGPMKETRDVIPVEGTTVEAFKRMIEYFYHVDIDCSEMTIKELFGIVDLAERYNVDKLKEEMTKQMEIVSIPMESLMEVVSIASEFSHFEVGSSTLLLNCAKVFQNNIRDKAAQLQFLVDQHACGKGLLALELITLVKTLECENCEDICRDGGSVREDMFRKGLKVKPNTSHSYWDSRAPGVATDCYKVVAVLGINKVNVKSERSQSEFHFYTLCNWKPTFCYDCRG